MLSFQVQIEDAFPNCQVNLFTRSLYACPIQGSEALRAGNLLCLRRLQVFDKMSQIVQLVYEMGDIAIVSAVGIQAIQDLLHLTLTLYL